MVVPVITGGADYPPSAMRWQCRELPIGGSKAEQPPRTIAARDWSYDYEDGDRDLCGETGRGRGLYRPMIAAMKATLS